MKTKSTLVTTVIAIVTLFGLQHANAQAPQEIKKSVPPLTRTHGNTTVRIYDGIIESQFGLNDTIAGNDLPEKALHFIRVNWQKFGIKEKPETAVRFIENKDLLGTHVVRIRQFYKDVPVDQNEFTFTFNKKNNLTGYFNNTIPVKKLESVDPKVQKDDAEKKVLSYLQAGSITGKTNELVVHIINFNAYLAYRIDIIANTPTGEWEAYVDANTGEILEIQNIADDLDGTGNVFEFDPVTSAKASYGTGNFIDNRDANNPDLQAQLSNVTLPDITFSDGQYKLQGPYAVISDHESPFSGLYEQSTPDFSYNRSEAAFEATMCYYHIDKSMRYINNTLGISIMPRQYAGGVQFDPHGFSGIANAHYVAGIGKVSFGSNSAAVDAAEDAGIILHELGHGIHHWLIGGRYPSNVEGLSEGCGDYWAKSYERSLGYWRPGEWGYNHILFWGMQPLFSGRVINYSATYPLSPFTPVHTAGQLWSSVLMKIYDDIGKEKTDRMFLVGLGYTNGSSSQADAANALYQAAVNLEYSNYELCIIHHHFSATYGTYFTQPLLAGSIADIFMQDSPADFGVEPNPDEGQMWVSPDIWVRPTNDGELLHQDPVYSATRPNYIYVRVRGRGCNTITDAQLHVYYTKSSTGLEWPATWMNFYTMTSHGSILTGNEITTIPIDLPPLAPGEEHIVAIPWFPPNPADFDAEIHHFCLLARIVSPSDPMFISETSDLVYNTRNNNNIAWKNLSVLNEGEELHATVFIRATSTVITAQQLAFSSPTEAWNPSFNENGQLYLTLRGPLYYSWLRGGRIGSNYTEVSPGKFLVNDQKFYLGGFVLYSQQTYMADVFYQPKENAKACAFDLIQSSLDKYQKRIIIGGERFEYRRKEFINDSAIVIDKGKSPWDFLGKPGNNPVNKQSISNQSLTLFPNPVHSVLYLENVPATTRVTIFSITGVAVKEITLVKGINAIDVGALIPGEYFIKPSGNVMKPARFIKK